jgi:tetratricopeptide (TPR) repeat protein
MTCSADCRQRQESVCALALGELESNEATELRQHVQSCPDCSTLFDAIENEEPALRAAFEAMAERAAPRTGLLRGRGVPPVAAGTVPLVRPARRVKSFYRVVAAGLAAAVLLAAGSALILSLSSQQVAYAIEQTVEALKDVRFLHLVNRTEDAKAADERWIEVGPDGFQARYRQDSVMPDGSNILVVDDRRTVMVYHRDKRTAVLYDPGDESYQWIANLGRFFQEMAGDSTVTIEENVAYRGRRAHRVRRLKTQQECYIDPASQLPIAVGPFEVRYEEPPQGTFTVAVPGGVQVIDKRAGAPPQEEPAWLLGGAEADRLLADAKAALAASDFATAVDLLRRTVALRPAYNWAWLWLGQAEERLGRHDDAIRAYSEAIRLYDTAGGPSPHARLARGLACRKKGMEAAARQDIGQALGPMIQALRRTDGCTVFDYADALLRGGEPGRMPPVGQSRAWMFERLREATGRDIGCPAGATAEQVEAAIVAWESWWNEHAKGYGQDLPQ